MFQSWKRSVNFLGWRGPKTPTKVHISNQIDNVLRFPPSDEGKRFPHPLSAYKRKNIYFKAEINQSNFEGPWSDSFRNNSLYLMHAIKALKKEKNIASHGRFPLRKDPLRNPFHISRSIITSCYVEKNKWKAMYIVHKALTYMCVQRKHLL